MTAGMNRETGRILEGFAHVEQCVAVIITTPVGVRVMREWFGSPVPKLLGQNLTPDTFMRFVQAVCIAVELFEPRFKVRRVLLRGTGAEAQAGRAGFNLLGDFRPRALEGDFTVDGGERSILIPV